VRQTPRIPRRHRTTVALSLLTGLGLMATTTGAAVAATDVAVTFTGTVTQGATPVAGAAIEVLEAPTLLGQAPAVVKTATTTSAGTYTVTASVPAGTRLYVRATRDDRGIVNPTFAESAVVGAGSSPTTAGPSAAAYPLVTPVAATASSIDADVALARLGTVAVVLGAGLDDASLERLDGTPAYPQRSSSTTTTLTFRGLYPGTYAIRGKQSGWSASTPRPVTVVAGTTTTVVVTRDAPTLSTITGKVTRKGKAQGKAAVNVYGKDGCLWSGTTTGKKGRYSLTVPTGSRYTVSFASHPTGKLEGSVRSPYVGADKKITVTAGRTKTVDARVKVGGILKGKVSFAKSVKLATVTVLGSKGRVVAARTVRSKKPAYTIAGLRKGTYTVVAQQRSGKRLYAKKAVKVRTAKTTRVTTLVPRKKGVTLTGTLPTKVAGSLVAQTFPCGLQTEDAAERFGSDSSGLGGSGTVRKSGAFTVKHLVPGTYYLQVEQLSAYVVQSNIRVKVKSRGSKVVVKKAPVPYSAPVTGVVTSSGNPVTNAQVWVDYGRLYPIETSLGVVRGSTTGALTGSIDPRRAIARVAVSFGWSYDDSAMFPANSPYYYSVTSPTTVTKPGDLAHIVLGPIKGA